MYERKRAMVATENKRGIAIAQADSVASARPVPRRKASVVGHLIFLAAEDSRDPTTGEVRGDTAEEQAEFLFASMKQTLESLGSSMAHVVSVTTVLTDAHHQPGYAKAKRKHLPHAPPSKAIYGPQLADPRLLLQIEATAVLPD